jgi:peptide/nickel transport system ATP-binding protein
VFRDPRHPYTRGLLDCIPVLGSDKHSRPLAPIPGQVPSALARPKGCIFSTRCRYVEPGRCTTERIPVLPIPDQPGHHAQCVRHAELPPWHAPRAAGVAAERRVRNDKVLDIDRLRKVYHQAAGIFDSGGGYDVKALNEITVSAARGTTLAIVGESGCGKSTLAKVLTGIERATEGKVILEGQEIGAISVENRPTGVKRKLQMVFQNPDSTLNPSHSVGFVIGRSLKRLKGVSARQAQDEVKRLLETVKLPIEFAHRKPRQLSGGQKQRVAIARALAGDPELVIADEPVSALDVSVQAAIINLLLEIQRDREATFVFISHDLSVVRYLADRVAVMYLGHIVEYGTVEEIFNPPYHPYTEALLSAVPVPDPEVHQKRIGLPLLDPLPAEDRGDLRHNAAARAADGERASNPLPYPVAGFEPRRSGGLLGGRVIGHTG